MSRAAWVALFLGAFILTHWLSAGADNIIHPQQYPTQEVTR